MKKLIIGLSIFFITNAASAANLLLEHTVSGGMFYRGSDHVKIYDNGVVEYEVQDRLMDRAEQPKVEVQHVAVLASDVIIAIENFVNELSQNQVRLKKFDPSKMCYDAPTTNFVAYNAQGERVVLQQNVACQTLDAENYVPGLRPILDLLNGVKAMANLLPKVILPHAEKPNSVEENHIIGCMAYFEGYVFDAQTQSCKRIGTSGCSNPFEHQTVDSCLQANGLK